MPNAVILATHSAEPISDWVDGLFDPGVLQNSAFLANHEALRPFEQEAEERYRRYAQANNSLVSVYAENEKALNRQSWFSR